MGNLFTRIAVIHVGQSTPLGIEASTCTRATPSFEPSLRLHSFHPHLPHLTPPPTMQQHLACETSATVKISISVTYPESRGSERDGASSTSHFATSRAKMIAAAPLCCCCSGSGGSSSVWLWLYALVYPPKQLCLSRLLHFGTARIWILVTCRNCFPRRGTVSSLAL